MTGVVRDEAFHTSICIHPLIYQSRLHISPCLSPRGLAAVDELVRTEKVSRRGLPRGQRRRAADCLSWSGPRHFCQGLLSEPEKWLHAGIRLPFAPVPELKAAIDTVVEGGAKQTQYPTEGVAAGPVHAVPRENTGQCPCAERGQDPAARTARRLSPMTRLHETQQKSAWLTSLRTTLRGPRTVRLPQEAHLGVKIVVFFLLECTQ